MEDICNVIKNFKITLVYIFILAFSLFGILSTFAGTPDPENASSSACLFDPSSTSSVSDRDITELGSSDPCSDDGLNLSDFDSDTSSSNRITSTELSSAGSNSPTQEK